MFADYNALRSAIISWADNDDVTARVDDFLALCHVRLNRKLRTENMSVQFKVPTVVGDPWVAKPDGYIGMRRLKVNASPVNGLTYKPLSWIDADVRANQQGEPLYYCPVGQQIRLGPIPNAEFELEFLYYQQQPTLSPTVLTNHFLTDASDLLLYGSLIEAEPWLKDHEAMPTWRALFEAGLHDLNVDTERQRFPDGDLAVEQV